MQWLTGQKVADTVNPLKKSLAVFRRSGSNHGAHVWKRHRCTTPSLPRAGGLGAGQPQAALKGAEILKSQVFSELDEIENFFQNMDGSSCKYSRRHIHLVNERYLPEGS